MVSSLCRFTFGFSSLLQFNFIVICFAVRILFRLLIVFAVKS